ncbi:MAG: S-adenosylmethionine:tRNA ribosyltransferase-isomerase [Salinivirgaceae bacterium]|nr:S-adenosylmethionine:tRNA ribosyltransferase-isomerase [Salinivirgaceae bacterium]
MTIQTESIKNYNYDLSDEKIAKYPLKQRDESKLLFYNNGELKQDTFKNLPSYIPENSLLVSNNTKVIRARLEFFKETGARIEVFCLEPQNPADYNISFSQNKKCTWQCIIGNLKKWKTDKLSKEITVGDEKALLTINKIGSINEAHEIAFSWDNPNLTFSEILENTGSIPIPPYLKRNSEESDLKTYQTIYSKIKGSVAAPTAGLHFTKEVFESLKQKNIQKHEVTLHVGAGTFKPIKSEQIGDHEMHTEQFIITKNTIPPLLENLGNITAVGTTTVRTLESLYWLGVKIIENTPNFNYHINQWDAYELNGDIPVKDALIALNEKVTDSPDSYINASTAIMIVPSYSFKLIDRLITNFHQPKSTLLLLIGAFIGKEWKDVYQYALDNKFRFLSYGDSCLFYRKKIKKGA